MTAIAPRQDVTTTAWHHPLLSETHNDDSTIRLSVTSTSSFSILWRLLGCDNMFLLGVDIITFQILDGSIEIDIALV